MPVKVDIFFIIGNILQDSEVMLVEDEDQDTKTINITSVTAIIDDYYFSQLPIEDRRNDPILIFDCKYGVNQLFISNFNYRMNPHGEHSEDTWIIKTNRLDVSKLHLEFSQKWSNFPPGFQQLSSIRTGVKA